METVTAPKLTVEAQVPAFRLRSASLAPFALAQPVAAGQAMRAPTMAVVDTDEHHGA